MATFALVHGAWFGSWCWTPLAVRLREMGHMVVAPDLPAGDPDADIADYAAVVDKAIDRAPDPAGMGDVILVGHSLGGLVIPVVAELRPVAGLIFLCAFLPEPGKPMQVDPDTFSPEWAALSAQQFTHDDGATTWPIEAGIQAFFHDLPIEQAMDAARQLRRQSWNPANKDSPLKALPTAPAAYVLCADDRVVSPAWSRRVARSRLGVDPIDLPGGHAPMLVDPDLMADLLDQMAAGLAQLRSGPPPG